MDGSIVALMVMVGFLIGLNWRYLPEHGRKLKELDEKIELMMRKLAIPWKNKEERRRLVNLVTRLYADGKTQEAREIEERELGLTGKPHGMQRTPNA